jgi:hypothetical protein
MTETSTQPQSPDLDEAVRKRVLERAKALNAKLLARFATAAKDLEAGQHRAALGGIGGTHGQIYTLRSLLLLLQ